MYRERINVLFVQGAAAYYHRNHFSGYVPYNKTSCSPQSVKLKQNCTRDVFEHWEYLGKLITDSLSE